MKKSATPFIKWVGGKRSRIPLLAKHFPDNIGTYWEPFVGGGAVFFALSDRIDRALLSDKNKELLITYKVVKHRVKDLIDALKEHEYNHRFDDQYFFKMRSEDPRKAIDIASRFIYLNKTCFNGLYSVNKAGKFNAAKGRGTTNICIEDGLRASSKALKKAVIKIGSFEKIIKPGADDFIYCDPPYDGSFNQYTADGFDANAQEELRDAIEGWVKRGANVMINNSDTPLIRRLYKSPKFKKYIIKGLRPLKFTNSGKQRAKELIITTYKYLSLRASIKRG